MSCYHPIRVPINKKRDGSPYRIRYTQEVGCGHCVGCRSDQARQWMIRLVHESRLHVDSAFVTLTYDDEHLPRDPHGTLVPLHLTNFWKRLRERVGRLSYYACGEYGELTKRPHYHAIIFGPHFGRKTDHEGRTFSTTIEDVWKKGRTDIGSVTPASCSYVAGYVMKKQWARARDDYYERVWPDTGEVFSVEPEFSRMSRRPAIGLDWISRWWPDVYPRDFVVIDGREMKPPRYYDKWMERFQPEIMADVKQKRYDDMEEIEPNVLRARETAHVTRNKLFSRGHL